VVLGCTHYLFVIPLIKEIVGEKVNVIDPTDAIVLHVSNLLDENNLSDKSGNIGQINIFTSGKVEDMKPILSKLFSENMSVEKIAWDNDIIKA
jgi:glutamate racemase